MRSKSFTPPELLALLAAKDQESCKFLDMRAALFSNFPEKFLRHSIIPKLEMRGVEVVSSARPDGAPLLQMMDAVDIVLFMHEMASHNDDRAVRNASRVSGLPMLCLSRKASSWEGKLPPVKSSDSKTFEIQLPLAATASAEEPKPEPAAPNTGDLNMSEISRKSVPDANLEPLLRRVMQLRGQGVKYADMIPELRQFWTNPSELKTGAQLQSYIGNVQRRPGCPEFYTQWVKAGREEAGAAEVPTVSGLKPKKVTMKTKKTRTQATRGMRGMPEKDLEKVLRTVMEQRDSGKQYKDILPLVRKHWPDGEGPGDADKLNKLVSSAAHSPRVPAWFKTWFKSAKTRSGVRDAPWPKSSGKKSDDLELARVYSEENEALKNRVSSLEDSIKSIKAQLMETLASCRKLVEIGAIDTPGAFNIATEFLRKI